MLRDFRLAFRTLLKRPGFAAAVILTFALGIGANTAIFSLVDGVLLRPLPYAAPARLFFFYEEGPQDGRRLASYPNFADYRAQATTLEGLAYVYGNSEYLRGTSGLERVVAGRVSRDFFRVLGTRPLLGRTFTADEEGAGGARVAVLTWDYWRKRFGGDPAIVGRTLETTGGAYEVIGVLPRGVRYPEWADLFTPIGAAAGRGALAQRGMHADSRVLARLAPGVTAEQARGELAMISARLAEAYPKENATWKAGIVPLEQAIVGDGVRPQLLMLLAAVGCVLLVACVNVANLALARTAARQRELAVRAALGAGRWRLVRQLVAEHLLLAAAGGALGVWLADVLVALVTAAPGTNLLATAAGDVLPRLQEVTLDGRVLLATAGLTLLAGVLSGLAPAWSASGAALATAAQTAGARTAGGREGRRLRAGLIVAQVALALVLLAGAGLLIASMRAIRDVPAGFEPDRLLAVHVMPTSPRYADPASDVNALYDRLMDAVRPLPGVRSVALVNHAPFGAAAIETPVAIDGASASDGATFGVGLRTVSTDYLATLRLPLKQGRWFGPADMTRSGAGAVVIDEAMARRYFPGTSPLGHRVTVFDRNARGGAYDQPVSAEVVGVVGEVRHFGLDQPAEPAVYVPYTMIPWGHVQLLVRTVGDPRALEPAVRRALLATEPDLALDDTRTMTERLDVTLAPRTFTMALLGGFAASALLLAAVGLYGVLAYLFGERTREIGIRMALGADAGTVRRLVLREGMTLVAAGVALGLVGALAVGRTIRGMLYGVSPADPATLAAVTVMLAGVALVAVWIPARRATRVDPVVALRAE